MALKNKLVTPENVRQDIINQKAKKTRAKNLAKSLTPSEAAYVAERIVPGVSPASAAKKAGLPKVPRKPRVQKAINAIIREQMDVKKLTAERVLLEVMRGALVDPAEFFDDFGELLAPSHMDEDTRRALAGWDVSKKTFGKEGEETEVTTNKIRFNKDKFLEMLMKHFGQLAGAGDSSQTDRLKELAAIIQAPYYANAAKVSESKESKIPSKGNTK